MMKKKKLFKKDICPGPAECLLTNALLLAQSKKCTTLSSGLLENEVRHLRSLYNYINNAKKVKK